MADRQIVGWFYRNGKRIPIFEKTGMTKDGKTTARTSARIEKDKVEDFYAFARTQGEPVPHPVLEYVAKNRVELTAKNKAQLRKNVNKRRDKPITEKTGANGHKYYSTDYDTSGGHVHKDHDTKKEARDFLKRNGLRKTKRTGLGSSKSNNNYRTNRFGKPYEDNEKGGDGHWGVNRRGKPYKK